MFEFYQALIMLRKNSPALRQLNRKNLSVEADKEKNTLVLKRWSADQKIICFMNFSNKQQFILPPADVDGFQKIFSSSDREWMGKQNASSTICAGKESSLALTLPKESVQIYANNNKL